MEIANIKLYTATQSEWQFFPKIITQFLSLILCVQLCGCHQNGNHKNMTTSLDDSVQTKDEIVLFGKFHGGQYLHYYYIKAVNQDINVVYGFDKDTTLTQHIEASIPLEININEGPSVIHYLFFPKDEVQIVNKSHNHFRLFSKSKIREQELTYQREFYPLIDQDLYASSNDDYAKIQHDLLKNYKYWTDHLTEALHAKTVSEPFHDYFNCLLTSKLITGLLFPVYNKRRFGEVSKVDQQLVNGLLKPDEKYLGLTTYRNSLWHYLKYITNKAFGTITAETLMKSAVQNFSGKPRDFLLARIVNEVVTKNSLGSIGDINGLLGNLEDDFYKNYILSELKVKTVPDGMLLDYDDKASSLNDLFHRAKDTVLYVDFWASWCLPCKEEMKFYPRLLEETKGKKIKFLFFSLDKVSDEWKDVSKDFSFMNKGNSFLVGQNFESTLARQLYIKSIPRYVIVKNGKILMDDAERPSSKKILKDLEKLNIGK